jgi:hypothetical protein
LSADAENGNLGAMTDDAETPANDTNGAPQAPGRWFLFLHQVPPQPAYFRARVLRQLMQLGAVSIKKSAYILPATEESLEDLQWLRDSIASEGGESWLFRCEAVAGHTDDTLREAFRAARDEDYRAFGAELESLIAEFPAGRSGGNPAAAEDERRERARRAARLRRRFDDLRKIDFFEAPQGREVSALMNRMEAGLVGGDGDRSAEAPRSPYHGRRWVTRRGVKVDRMASTWLISRFIDPAPKFAFVDPDTYRPRDGDLRFDMFEGEFTHHQGRCTFEVLLDRLKLEDPALKPIGQIVHDLDLKETLYDLPETRGVAMILDGIVARSADDETRLKDSRPIFDALYEQFARR